MTGRSFEAFQVAIYPESHVFTYLFSHGNQFDSFGLEDGFDAQFPSWGDLTGIEDPA